MSPVISIENITKKFGGQTAVSNFSIEVFPQDVFAFLGSNGSGKTTTLRCLLNIYQPDSGRINLLGQNNYSTDLAHQVGYLPEERGVYTRSKVGEVFSYFADLRGIAKSQQEGLIQEYLKRVNLWEHKDKKVSQLSSGMQQKVQIGITILHKPQLLILDEPFKGLDPLNRQLFLDIFQEMREQGSTILYSTHVVDEVQRMANRLVMIKNGQRVLYGSINEIRSQFGSNNLMVNFTRGTLPKKDDLYSARGEHNYAELTPKAGVSPQNILRFLFDQGLEITEFQIDRPSLNSIFIEQAK
jgi:ABC-2 type transport system ATP-binding protein